MNSLRRNMIHTDLLEDKCGGSENAGPHKENLEFRVTFQKKAVIPGIDHEGLTYSYMQSS